MSDELIELPKGWEWVALEEIAIHKSGIAFKSENFTRSGIQVIRLGNVYKGQLNLERDPVYLPEKFAESYFTLKPGDIVVSQTGTRFKRDYGYFVLIPINSPPLLLNQRILSVSCHTSINPQYVVLASELEVYRNYFFSNETGGVNQGNVGVAGVMGGKIPLPPSDEQKRIVAKIEEFRSKTQKAREALEAIPEMCDRFRQSVLDAAFRGDLTADWREENSDIEPAKVLLENIRKKRYEKWETELIKREKPTNQAQYKKPEPANKLELPALPPEWEWATIEELAETSLGKMLDKGKEKKGRPFPYLRNINVRWNHIDTSDLLEMYFEEDELERYSVKSGDILICEGGEPGRAAVWTGDSVSFKYQKALHRVRPFLPLEPLWLIYHLKFEASIGALEQYFTGTTIKHFTGVALARYPVRLPSLEEQKEVILRIQNLFALVNGIQQQYEAAKAQLEKLDRTILAKAFRGELVPQDPNDEPASVLLDRIREEREKEGGAKKKRGKTAKTSKS